MTANHRCTPLLFLALLAIIFVAMLALPSQAQTFTVLHTFTGAGDGSEPNAGLTIDRGGNFYGTTYDGAAGYGTVFKLSRAGSGWLLTTLYEFQGGDDGAMPETRVVFGLDGSLYGTTSSGGGGNGTVFNLRPPASNCRSSYCPWTETVLYRFLGGSDGANPQYGDLTFDAAGNIYGTTSSGGGGCTAYAGCGVVFKLTSSGGQWTESVLYAFENGNGQTPFSGVIFDSAGNLYGTALYGGTQDQGTVYELTQSGSGWTETTLHNFGPAPDGANPFGGLAIDQHGNLYGTTSDGGTGSSGTVYELQPAGGNWIYITLYSFSGFGGSRDTPTLDASGNLYATVYDGGDNGFGNVFKVSPGPGGRTYTDLHDFNFTEGYSPLGGVVLDSNGNLYGTTQLGGGIPSCGIGCGVIWEITP